MTDSIDLTKMNILTDSMYDTKGTGYTEGKKQMIYTTPFEQQAKYNQRSCNKPFQASKYPSSGIEWYAKRAVNDVDLQTDMNKVLPEQQVQNWSRTKTVIVQNPEKETYKNKETMSNLEELKQKINRHNRRNALKSKKETYITTPYDKAEDTWSSAGAIKDFGTAEKFEAFGHEIEIVDIIIVILVIAILIIGIFMYMSKKKTPIKTNEQVFEFYKDPKHVISDEEHKAATRQFSPEQFDKYKGYIEQAKSEGMTSEKFVEDEPENKKALANDYIDNKTRGGNEEPQTLNCGSLCGGAAFDTTLNL